MAVLLADAPTDRLAASRGVTTFEREMLPALTRWVLDRLDRLEADYLVPIETKGARLLEAIAAYAEEELGRSLGAPLIYATALAYMDPEELAQKTFVIFDDAVNTGTNLCRHRDRLARYGVREVHALAFVGCGPLGAGAPRLECYQVVGPDAYHEYLWQLADVVIARGLPPEVDHQLFELRLPDRLPVGWARLREALTHFGTLNIDGPESRNRETLPMTLHFPAFPGAMAFPTEGRIRNEGVSKVRFFADAENERIVVVPISFPTLDLAPDTPIDSPLEEATALVHSWTGCRDGAAGVLIEDVCTPDPEAVFRMLSACTEVELVRGLARVLGASFPEGGVTVRALRTPFRKLYGSDVGQGMASHVDEELQTALRDGAGLAEMAFAGRTATDPVFLTRDIADATRKLAGELRELSAQRAASSAPKSEARVGLTMSEIVNRMPGHDRLLASRCVGYGLATTLLVPCVRTVIDPIDGTVSVRRVYRLSEGAGTDHVEVLKRCESIADWHQRQSEEALAHIALFVQDKIERYHDAPAPLTLLAQLVAILHPLELAKDEGLKLHAEPGERDPRVILDHRTHPVTVHETTSRFFTVDSIQGDGVDPVQDDESSKPRGITPTAAHKQRSRSRSAIDSSALDIEDWLLAFQPLLQLAETEQQRLLAPWAMCSDGWLGMEHVLWNLDEALRCLKRPLERVLGQQEHPASPDLADRAHTLAVEARGKIDRLMADWAPAVRESVTAGRLRRTILEGSLGAAEDPGPILDLAIAVVELTSSLCGPVDRLEEISHESWTGSEATIPAEEVERIVKWCARMQAALTSLSGDSDPDVTVSPGREGVYEAAHALQGVAKRLAAYAAALAGDYRGAWERWRTERRSRSSTIVAVDMVSSMRESERRPPTSSAKWKNDGLNLVAQWGKALSGDESWNREGDLAWIEFEGQGDAAIIAAAITQEHLAALRSAGNPLRSWSFRFVAERGDLHPADVDNTIAACLDRASRLSDAVKGLPDSATRVYLAPDATASCSAAITEELSEQKDGNPFMLTEGSQPVRPWVVQTRAVVERLTANVNALAAEIQSEMPAPLVRAQLEIKTTDVGDDETGDAGATGEADPATS